MKEQPLPVISVIGTGYVGLTTAVLLAEAGYTVYAVDIDTERLDVIKNGRSFFYEEGMDNLVQHAVVSKKLIPTSSYKKAVSKSGFVFSCVGTPDNPDGSANLEYVFSAAKEAAKYMHQDTIYVQKSTVPVGTGNRIEQTFSKLDSKIGYVSNPEFLREGTAISDSLWFDRIVAGSDSKEAINKVLGLYRVIEKNRDLIAKRAGISAPQSRTGSYIGTNRNSAELIKVTANAFLALKISFANSIAKIADKTGADINEVMDAVGADRRIGRAFLNAGRGYGGGCFPKDVSGLISSASEIGMDLSIMIAADELNESMPGYIANKARKALGKPMQGVRMAVLGLSFKAGTSDARRSPGVKLANILAHGHAIVTTYDPEANGEAKEELRRDVKVAASLREATRGCCAVFIATDWPEFMSCDLTLLKNSMEGKLFVDCVNGFNVADVEAAGLQYIGVGRNGSK